MRQSRRKCPETNIAAVKMPLSAALCLPRTLPGQVASLKHPRQQKERPGSQTLNWRIALNGGRFAPFFWTINPLFFGPRVSGDFSGSNEQHFSYYVGNRKKCPGFKIRALKKTPILIPRNSRIATIFRPIFGHFLQFWHIFTQPLAAISGSKKLGKIQKHSFPKGRFLALKTRKHFFQGTKRRVFRSPSWHPFSLGFKWV